MTRTGILIQPHAGEAMRRRGIGQGELLAALGPDLVEAGELRVVPASTAHIAEPGRPIRLGWQPPAAEHGDRRHVLLARSPRGRHLVVVLVVGRASVTVITVWDQDGEPHWWQADRLAPTELGRRQLPPTYWCVSGRWDVTNKDRR